jgi:hypothetical protein
MTTALLTPAELETLHIQLDNFKFRRNQLNARWGNNEINYDCYLAEFEHLSCAIKRLENKEAAHIAAALA